MESNTKGKKRVGNFLTGKPSNNKGKKRVVKVPRRSVFDVSLQQQLSKQEDEEDSDAEENLDHIPITAHMYRSAFVKLWCSKITAEPLLENAIVADLLGHEPSVETNCIIRIGETPTCHTVDHWRKNIKVKGKVYTVPEIKRPGDRNVRDYHFWMYNSGNFTREQLATMVSPKNAKEDKGDAAGGSHVCGGMCLNHARPEGNKINQERKGHHAKMMAALDKGRIDTYQQVRTSCQHMPKCFINPRARGGGLEQKIISANLEAYNKLLQIFQ